MKQNIRQELIADKTSLSEDNLTYLFIIDGLDECYRDHINQKHLQLWLNKDTQATRDEIKTIEFELDNLDKTFYSKFMLFLSNSKFSTYNFVYIFNTNNNNVVFGDAAINNRIMKRNFDLANKNDIVVYLQHFLCNYNNSMIRDDIKNSYRDLYCIVKHYGEKINNAINYINIG